MFAKLVRRCATVGVLSFSILSAASYKSLAEQSVLPLIIRNQNELMIGTVYVKYPDSEDWSVVGSVFFPGEGKYVYVKTEQCVIDIAVTYEMKNGNITYDTNRQNICEQNTYTVIGNGGSYKYQGEAAIQAEYWRQIRALEARNAGMRLTNQIFWGIK